VIHYEGDLGKTAPKGEEGQSANGQKISRMLANGSVTISQKEQRAAGDQGDFDMRKNTLVLTGNVVVTRGDDVLRGQSLFVDLTTGVSKMDSGGGRVEGMFKANQGSQQKPGRTN
jgi:lipopolysaccharide export system protein LptA